MNVVPKMKQEDSAHVKEFLKAVSKLSSSAGSFKDSYIKKHNLIVYNPLEYARKSLDEYLRLYLQSSVKVILLGMNPGPFGMAQTGIPFGDVSMVRDWMSINREVNSPALEHPKRPVSGFDCKRSEVSGSRLWGWAKERYGTPDNFFTHYFVWNYCPLVFMEESGANKTPDKIERDEQKILFEMCDEALRSLVKLIEPGYVIGVGKFAMKRAANGVGDLVPVSDILHPSPASPKANKDWKGEVEKKLGDLGCLF